MVTKSPSTLPRRIGVVGGMGPAATIDFYQKLTTATPATRDQDHLQVLIWSDPHIPDRTEALLSNGPDPGPWIEAIVQRLKAEGCTLIAIPCNTAHAFAQDLETHLCIQLVDMITATVDATMSKHPALKKVAILATSGTIRIGLYQRRFARCGVEVIEPTEHEQEDIMHVVHSVKSGVVGPHQQEAVHALIESVTSRGAEATILGCTELPLVSPDLPNRSIIDPTKCLAEAVVAEAFHRQ